jgi:microcompartment protein CcmL/EutN
VYLPDIARAVAEVLVSGPNRLPPRGDAAGIVETTTVAAAIVAADAAAKEAEVGVSILRLADGLGGKGFFVVDGDIGEVTSSVAAAVEAAGDRLVATKVIALLTDEIRADLGVSSRLSKTIRDGATG